MSYTESDHKEWAEFKVQFKKGYENDEEDLKRKEIYFQNKKQVEEHNKRYESGEATWKMGINQFSDLTTDEFKNRHQGCSKPQ